MKNTKVAHLITGLDIGGTELMLLKVMKNRGVGPYEHIVISLKQKGRVAKSIEETGVRVVSLDMKWYNLPLGLMKLFFTLKKEKPDILHNYLFHADVIGRICGRAAGVPVIVSSFRSVDVGGRAQEFLLRLTDGFCDVVTAVSKNVAAEHIRKKTTIKKDIKVICNGLEIGDVGGTEKRLELRKKAGIAPGDFLILSVGNLRPVKGYLYIFDAVKTLESRGRDVKLLILGEGEHKKVLESVLSGKGLSGKVIFAGEKDNVPDFLSMADVFVMASLWEGLPNALLEAMAAGLPVVATRVGGIPEVVRDNENGILVNSKDGVAIAEAIERIITDRDFSHRLGKNAREYVRENFDIKRTVSEIEKLYTESLSRKFGVTCQK